MKKYEIRITKVETTSARKRGDWTVIDERPWTQEELDEKCRGGDLDRFLERSPVKSIYGYAQDWEGITQTETEILRQSVDELDIPAVIKAINGI